MIDGIRGEQQLTIQGTVREFFGTNYGHGFFKYKACDYCDDVFAETADVVIGDAWLPEYVVDGRGTSILLIRNRDIQEMVDVAQKSGRLHLEPLDADKAAHSQAGGLRHRREGLKYRLAIADANGKWLPKSAKSRRLTV